MPKGARAVVGISSGFTGLLAVLVLWLLARTYSRWGTQEPFWRAFVVLFPVAIVLVMICLYFLLRYPRITIFADRVVVVRQTYRPGDIKALDLSLEEDYMHGRYGTPMMYVLAFTIDDGTGERIFRMNVRDPSFNVVRLVAGLRQHLPHLTVRGP